MTYLPWLDRQLRAGLGDAEVWRHCPSLMTSSAVTSSVMVPSGMPSVASSMTSLPPEACLVPGWGSHGGVNDRFAVCGRWVGAVVCSYYARIMLVLCSYYTSLA